MSDAPPWELLGQRPGSSEWIEVAGEDLPHARFNGRLGRVGRCLPASREQFRLKVSWTVSPVGSTLAFGAVRASPNAVRGLIVVRRAAGSDSVGAWRCR